MTTLARRLPNSNLGRDRALKQAHDKFSSIPATTVILHPNTSTRLGEMRTDYKDKQDAVAAAQAALSVNTPLKDAAVQKLKKYVSHFIQVFNLGVDREKYPAAHRAFYHLEVSSAAVPNLDAEADVFLWAGRLIDGDAERVAAGGAAMANPDIAEVTTERDAAQPLYTNQSTLADALDTAQEDLEALNPEADKLIKRVWNEVETFYSEEEAGSMRDNAREWGVVYVAVGPGATLTGLVKNPAGEPLEGIGVELAETGATAVTNPEGRFNLSTTFIGDGNLVFTFPGLENVNQPFTLEEESAGTTVDVGEVVMG